MKIQGNLDFRNNNVNNFVLEPYDGSQNPFPTEGVVPGRIVFRTDLLQVYVCVSNNPVVWQPIIKVADFFEYNESVNKSNWLITHNLNTESVFVQVYDTNKNQVIPEEITIVDSNNVNISFGNNTMAGKALVVALNSSIGSFVDRMALSLDVLKSKVEINNITYDDNDNPTSVTYSDGHVAQLTYNSNNDIETLTFKDSNNNIVEQWQYSYDTQNRLVSTTRTV